MALSLTSVVTLLLLPYSTHKHQKVKYLISDNVKSEVKAAALVQASPVTETGNIYRKKGDSLLERTLSCALGRKAAGNTEPWSINMLDPISWIVHFQCPFPMISSSFAVVFSPVPPFRALSPSHHCRTHIFACKSKHDIILIIIPTLTSLRRLFFLQLQVCSLPIRPIGADLYSSFPVPLILIQSCSVRSQMQKPLSK